MKFKKLYFLLFADFWFICCPIDIKVSKKLKTQLSFHFHYILGLQDFQLPDQRPLYFVLLAEFWFISWCPIDIKFAKNISKCALYFRTSRSKASISIKIRVFMWMGDPLCAQRVYVNMLYVVCGGCCWCNKTNFFFLATTFFFWQPFLRTAMWQEWVLSKCKKFLKITKKTRPHKKWHLKSWFETISLDIGRWNYCFSKCFMFLLYVWFVCARFDLNWTPQKSVSRFLDFFFLFYSLFAQFSYYLTLQFVLKVKPLNICFCYVLCW